MTSSSTSNRISLCNSKMRLTHNFFKSCRNWYCKFKEFPTFKLRLFWFWESQLLVKESTSDSHRLSATPLTSRSKISKCSLKLVIMSLTLPDHNIWQSLLILPSGRVDVEEMCFNITRPPNVTRRYHRLLSRVKCYTRPPWTFYQGFCNCHRFSRYLN